MCTITERSQGVDSDENKDQLALSSMKEENRKMSLDKEIYTNIENQEGANSDTNKDQLALSSMKEETSVKEADIESQVGEQLVLNQNMLLDAVEVLTPNNLVKLFFPSKESSNKSEFLDCIKESRNANGKRFLRRLFSGMINILEKIINRREYVPSSLAGDNSVESKMPSVNPEMRKTSVNVSPDEGSSQALLFIRYCSQIITAHLQGMLQKSNRKASMGPIKVSNEPFRISSLLHDIILSFESCGNKGRMAQKDICIMCEEWWHGNFEHREHLVPQLIPLIFSRSLDDKPTKEDISRLFKIRVAFDLFDFEDESIAYLKSLCLRTIKSPVYLRNSVGENFIAYLFQINESMVVDLHKAIKVQIPSAKKFHLKSFGNIYLKAWKLSENNLIIRKAMEEYVFHDLVHSVIHLSSSSTYKALRQVLTPLHHNKSTPEIDKLLNRIYGPILWRSLSASNPFIRINAAEIFAVTFPLHDPDDDVAQIDACRDKSVNALHKLMLDRDPRVRVSGSAATSKILARFWDAIPATGIRSLLTCIITKHASDASSADVRLEAMSAITLLLNECVESQAVLRQLLPILGNLIHDRVEKVRLAVCRILAAIKKIKGIRYYHVVPIDHLLARLSEEKKNPSSPVASAITSLLLNSYFPQRPDTTGTEQVQRTLSFLSSNFNAAIVFYQNISTHLSLKYVCKLAVMLIKFLSSSIHNHYSGEDLTNDDPGGAKRTRTSNMNNSKSKPMRVNEKSSKMIFNDILPNTSILAAVAETITHILNSACKSFQQKENIEYQEFILHAFSETVLTDILTFFDSKKLITASNNNCSAQENVLEINNNYKRISIAVLRWAAITSSVGNKMSQLINHVTEEIDEYGKTPSANSEIDISSHFALLCQCGKKNEVATSLSKPIVEAFDLNKRQSSDSKRRKRKNRTSLNTTIDFVGLSPHVAIHILVDIFQDEDSRQLILSHKFSCQTIQSALWDCTKIAERLLNRNEDYISSKLSEDASLVLEAFELYGKTILHKEALEKNSERLELNSQAKSYFSWISTKVVSCIMKESQEDCLPFNLNLSGIDVDGSMVFDTTFETNERLSTSFNDIVDTNIFTSAFAISIIKIGMFICSDFIAIGGAGSEEISKHVLEWMPVLSRFHREHLFPCFCKLTFQLVSMNRSYELLKELLTLSYPMDSKIDNNMLIQKTILSTLKANNSKHNSNSNANETEDHDRQLERMAEAIFSSKSNFSSMESVESDDRLPSSLEELFKDSKDVFSVALIAFINFSLAGKIAAINFIVNSINKIDLAGGECKFFIRCLYVFKNELGLDDQMKEAFLQIDHSRFDKNLVEYEIISKLIDFK